MLVKCSCMALSTSSRTASTPPPPFLYALAALWRVCLSFTMMYNYKNTSVVQGNFNESVEKTVQTYRSLDSLDTFRSPCINIFFLLCKSKYTLHGWPRAGILTSRGEYSIRRRCRTQCMAWLCVVEKLWMVVSLTAT